MNFTLFFLYVKLSKAPRKRYNMRMIITYYGLSCFKIQSGDTVLAIDPFSKETGLMSPRFQADVVLSTKGDVAHNNTDALMGEPFPITDPGEYEIKGIAIEGMAGDLATMYAIDWEGMRLCHLGATGTAKLSDEVRAFLGTPDVLFVPVGGSNSITAAEAASVVTQIEPRIIVPMYYALPGLRQVYKRIR
jgi:L-ascorbate metabolism protein UlaG (beta-lactamase superfamily)